MKDRFYVKSFNDAPPSRKGPINEWLQDMRLKGYHCVQSHSFGIRGPRDSNHTILVAAEDGLFKQVRKVEPWLDWWELPSGGRHFIRLDWERTRKMAFHSTKLTVFFDFGSPAESGQDQDFTCFFSHVIPEIQRLIAEFAAEVTKPTLSVVEPDHQRAHDHSGGPGS